MSFLHKNKQISSWMIKVSQPGQTQRETTNLYSNLTYLQSAQRTPSNRSTSMRTIQRASYASNLQPANLKKEMLNVVFPLRTGTRSRVSVGPKKKPLILCQRVMVRKSNKMISNSKPSLTQETPLMIKIQTQMRKYTQRMRYSHLISKSTKHRERTTTPRGRRRCILATSLIKNDMQSSR